MAIDGVELEKGVLPTRRFLVFLPEFPSLAAGPGDTLYAAWSDGRNGDEDVFVRRSQDDGATWSEPNSRIGASAAQHLPVDFGSRLALDSGSDRSLAAWAHSRLGTQNTGRQDILSAVYVDARLPALARVPAIAALIVLALAFAAVGFVTRRRQNTQGTPN